MSIATPALDNLGESRNKNRLTKIMSCKVFQIGRSKNLLQQISSTIFIF